MGEPASQQFPRLYPILDQGLIESRGIALGRIAEELKAAGVMLAQYRNKVGERDSILRNASEMWEVFDGSGCRFLAHRAGRRVVAILAAALCK